MHIYAGWPALTACSLSAVAASAVFLHASFYRPRHDSNSMCVRWLAFSDIVVSVVNLAWIDWSPGEEQDHHLVGTLCEGSAVACVAIAMVDLGSICAVGLWTNCRGYQMLGSLLCPSPSAALGQSRMRMYHIISWGGAAVLAVLGTILGCTSVGCSNVAWEYKTNHRLFLFLLPSILCLVADLVICGIVAVHLHKHSTLLNVHRAIQNGILYAVAIAVSWGPYVVVAFLLQEPDPLEWEYHGFGDRTGLKVAYSISHAWAMALGVFHGVIYFLALNSTSLPGRKFIQFEEAHLPDGDGARWRRHEHHRILLEDASIEEALMSQLYKLVPEGTAPELRRILERVRREHDLEARAQMADDTELFAEVVLSLRQARADAAAAEEIVSVSDVAAVEEVVSDPSAGRSQLATSS